MIRFYLALLIAGSSAAQTVVNQGKPGTQGSWPVTASGILSSDSGIPFTQVNIFCTGSGARVTAVGTSPVLMPTSTGQTSITICNSSENSGQPLVKCLYNLVSPTMGKANAGDVLAKGDCFEYPISGANQLSCVSDTAGTAVTSNICGESGSFSLTNSYVFGPPTVVACTVANGCSVQGQPNAGLTAWVTLLQNGSATGITDIPGVGTTFRTTQMGWRTMTDVDSAEHPSATLPAGPRTILGGDWLMVLVGYATEQVDPTFQHWYGHTDGVQNAVTIRNEGGDFKCTIGGSIASTSAVAGRYPINGWSISSCRMVSGILTARVNGVDGVPADTTGDGIGPVLAGASFNFGDRAVGGFPLKGPLASWTLYSDSTTANIAAIEAAAWGLPTGLVSSIGSGSVCYDYDGGTNECFLIGAAIVDPTLGLRTINGAATTNLWAANNLLATAGTDVGTPTITANASAGPFFNLLTLNEGALVVDNDSTNFEGKKGTSGYVANPLGSSRYTASYWFSAGTSGVTKNTARVTIDVTGGGWSDAGVTTYCDFALTSQYTRYSCTSPAFIVDAGSPTVTTSYLVGDAGSQTGSITVYERQLNPKAWVEVPAITNTAVGDARAVVDTTTWPSVAGGGRICSVFAPIFDPLNQFSTDLDPVYLFDANDGTDHSEVCLLGYNLPGRILCRTESGNPFTDLVYDSPALVPGQLYELCIQWIGTAPGTCSTAMLFNSCGSASKAACIGTATTSVASATGAVCPSQPTTATLGIRMGNAFPSDFNIGALTVWSYP